jgi:phosphoribosylanthranilate isomerase
MANVKPLIKICGITNLDDAKAAVDAGADMLGLIFVESSPRHIHIEEAKKISAQFRDKVKLVGVLVDANPAKMLELQELLGLHYIQCHGSESVKSYEEVKPVIKAIAINGDNNWQQDVATHRKSAELLLFDKPKTLKDNHWLDQTLSTLSTASSMPNFLFAGGLTPDNVQATFKQLQVIRGFRGIDVASGVEASPGKKDHDKMYEFCKIIRENVNQG